jgi:hypothetical protein
MIITVKVNLTLSLNINTEVFEEILPQYHFAQY